MSHQTARRATAPTNLECPLASLGRTDDNAMNTLSGLHQSTFQHPLSSSPLDPKVYQRSRKSPDLSIDADDVIYTPKSVSMAQCSVSDTIDTALRVHHQQIEPQSRLPMYNLSRTSSTSSLDQTSPTIQRKAATFELRGRHHNHHFVNNVTTVFNNKNSSASVGRIPPKQHRVKSTTNTQRNFLALDDVIQYANRNDGVCTNGYILNNNNTNIDDDSHNVNKDNCGIIGGFNDSTTGNRLNHIHSTVRHNAAHNVISNGNTPPPLPSIYLEKKMDALYFGDSAINGLPMILKGNRKYENEPYYLDDNLRNVTNFSNIDNRLQDQPLLHRRISSPSETSGSDHYLLNRTNSPANVFNNTNLENYSNTNNHVSSLNLTLDQRYHQTKIQNLSDGLCNLGRFSPSLDQGYATLVSPSPTGHHSSNAMNTHSIVHHPTTSTMTSAAMVAHRHIENGPTPWNRKGPYRTGPYFDRLTDEAIIKIFSWLQTSDLCKTARVCRRFEQIAWMPILWKIIILKGEHFDGDKVLRMIFRQLCGQTRNGSCPHIERVLLSDGCKISDKGLQLLTRRCPELTHLQLQNCFNISNQALMDAFTKCTNIQHLDVTGCTQINTIAPSTVNIEPSRRLLLQYLDLTDCLSLDDVGLRIVVKNCPQLIYLYLRRCIQISDAGLKFVPSFCLALKELSVSDCISITDFGLYELAKLGAALRYLSVAKCDQVSDAGLKVIARRCYKLRYLNARGCEAVSDDSITVLARSCPRLRALDIGKCDVSDAGLRALAESCPNLKKLSLRNCDMITDRGVQCIAYYCRGLQQLNIQDCQISIEGYRAVKKYCKRCTIEHTNPGFC